jgi:symplekin
LSNSLFSKTICQVPLLTENSLKLLKSFCQDQSRFFSSLSTLSDLIKTRLGQRQVLLTLLLELTHEKKETIRQHAITLALKLHESPEFKPMIEQFSVERLKNLAMANPPVRLVQELSSDDQIKDLETIQWTEETIKSCLYLFLELMPANHELIHS